MRMVRCGGNRPQPATRPGHGAIVMSEPLGDKRKRLDNLLQSTVEEHNPSFSTRGVCNAGRRSRTTSWSKGLYHRSDVLVLIQKLTARVNAGWRLSRQCELELLEQDFMIGLWMGVAA